MKNVKKLVAKTIELSYTVFIKSAGDLPFTEVMHTNYPDKYITMGLKIAYYRKKAGYTQEAFAEEIGKSVDFLAQIEGTGTVRGISLETLFRIAECLNISPVFESGVNSQKASGRNRQNESAENGQFQPE